MRVSDICISRPVLATVLNIVLVLVGLVAFSRLTVREYPNIDVPTVTVSTTYPGANAEIIETQVTKIVEDQLSGIEGIDYITSISRAESSQITVVFKLNRDPDAAASDVRDRVGRARDTLPDEVDEPVIAKVEADAQPIIYLAFSSDRHTELEVTDAADRLVQDRLQTLPGVADAQIFGERRYAMRIWLDPERLAALQVTTQEVEAALRAQNVEIPAGRIESIDREFTVLAETDVATISGFEEIVLRDSDGYLVRLRDVARIEVGPEEERSIARFNGQSAVAIGIVKQSTANPLEVSEGVGGLLPSIQATLPEGMEVVVAYDSTIFIAASIDDVYKTIAEAVLLVVLVIFFFLRSVRAVIIPIVTIPVSLIGAFALMLVMGFSINTLTLLAMVMAIGLVVDDAIVVLENIYRHIENGLSPMAAAFKGSREIAFAIISVTITIAAVFVPVGFTEGRTGKLFTEFALTLSAAVIISGFIALTLSPMMCSRLLKPARPSQRRLPPDRALLRRHGAAPIAPACARSWRSASSWCCSAAWSPSRPSRSTRTSTPSWRRWRTAASSSASSRAGGRHRRLHGPLRPPDGGDLRRDPGGRALLHGGRLPGGLAAESPSSRLEDWDERERKTAEVAGSIGGMMFGVKGVLAFPINPQSLGQSGIAKPVEVVIQTTGSYEDLAVVIDQVLARIATENPRIVNLDTDLKLNKPEIRISVNRDKLAAVGIEVNTVGRTLETMLGGRNVTRFKRDGEQYDVVVQVADVDRSNPDDLNRIYLRGKNGEIVQLSNLVTLKEGIAPRELNHFNKLRAVTLTANLAPGYSQGEALDYVSSIVREVGGPAMQIDYSGSSREYQESSSSLAIAFVLAVGFVFLVMAAQFESWSDPFIVMLAVPLAMMGGLLALNLTGGTLNIYSQIGLISLVGLITKNGILVVEFANQLREQKGLSIRDAAIESATLRLRPVLMTAFALILGTLPLALATGAGAESRQQIGWVIVGGMSVGTLFTLYVVPTFYTLLSGKRHRVEIPGASH